MTDEPIDEEQKHQEQQYEYPYHYIPQRNDGSFSQTQQWSWGFRYLGGIEVVLDTLADRSFDSVIDIGCGDGRFLRELRGEYPDLDTLGVDYSQRSVNLANAMNPTIDYECRDITDHQPDTTYNVGTLIEVLEHIPLDEVDEFLSATAERLTTDGTLVLTVPHENKSVNKKHYQHFSSSSLEDILVPHFDCVTVRPFDNISSLVLKVFERLTGNQGEHFLITNDTIMTAFWNIYRDRYLYTTEKRCGRLVATCEL